MNNILILKKSLTVQRLAYGLNSIPVSTLLDPRLSSLGTMHCVSYECALMLYDEIRGYIILTLTEWTLTSLAINMHEPFHEVCVQSHDSWLLTFRLKINIDDI